MDYSLTSESGEPMKPEDILQHLLNIYERGNSSFKFHLIRNGDWLHVVPKPVKMSEGDVSVPILDTRISVPGDERSLEETLRLVTQALAQKTGQRVGIGTSPINFLTRSRVGADFQIQDEPARIALARLLGRFEVKLCWRFLYSPGSMHVLNLIPVPFPEPLIIVPD